MNETQTPAVPDDIEQDRRRERRLILQAVIALAIVAAFVVVRQLIVG